MLTTHILNILLIILILLLLFPSVYGTINLSNLKLISPKEHFESQLDRSSIPKVIYKSGKGKPVREVQNLFDKTLRNNPGFKLEYYDDEQCRKFIKVHFEKDVLEAFDILKPGAYKADLFRYCILYQKGGVWSDLTDDYLVPLEEIINFEKDELFLVDDRPVGKNNMAGIQISFMAARPKNKLYLKCIRQIVKNCQNRILGETAFEVTGPHLCRRKLQECLKEDPNFKVRIDYKFSDDGHHYVSKKTGKKFAKYKSVGKHNLDKILDKKQNYYLDMWLQKDIYHR